MIITIENIDESTFRKIMGSDKSLHFGEEVLLPCGSKSINLTPDGDNFSENSIFTFALSFLGTISVGIISNTLYDKLKKIMGIKEKVKQIDAEKAFAAFLNSELAHDANHKNIKLKIDGNSIGLEYNSICEGIKKIENDKN